MSGSLGLLLAMAESLRADIEPTSVSESIANGTDVAVDVLTVNINGGTPPYTVLWTEDMSNVSFSDDAAETTTLLSTGTNTEKLGTVTCTVTDAIGAIVAPDIGVNIQQGTPP